MQKVKIGQKDIEKTAAVCFTYNIWDELTNSALPLKCPLKDDWTEYVPSTPHQKVGIILKYRLGIHSLTISCRLILICNQIKE